MTEENIELLLKLLPKETLNTIIMAFSANCFAILIGFPIGVLLTLTARRGLSENPMIYKTLETVVNIGRSFPFAILMVALIPFTRAIVGTSLGTIAAIVPLSVAAAPFIARVTENALKSIDRHVIEAAIIMGATRGQIVTKVMIQEALPSLIQGITLTQVNLIGLSAMAGLIGGGGLGQVAIQYGYQRFNPMIMIATVFVLIVLVQLIQLAGNKIEGHILKKRGKIER